MKAGTHTKTILVFGTKSSGKSTVLNKLIGTKKFPSSKPSPELASFTSSGNTYIEVPDISQIANSVRKENDEVVKNLREKCKAGVSCAIFCYPITHVRCDSDKQEVMKFIKALFKSKVPDMAIVFTFCSMLNAEELKRAKRETAKEVKKFFEQTFNCSIKCTAFYERFPSNLLPIAKHIGSLAKISKDIETWKNLQKYLENARKNSAQMLLAFAEIMEEQKQLEENVMIYKDTPNDSHPINTPNTSQPILTKKAIGLAGALVVTRKGYSENMESERRAGKLKALSPFRQPQ
eukprot:TRINITY_DN13129_c0_g1_i6.p1 TRINITY_DN13129_c0_g1~~TRINITY_DN13129_c0_g1_i6.p1  ORF type:complete len:291 (-),score=55.49 TRINITY_DN13129_c0_g1_i6:161-1033(-)